MHADAHFVIGHAHINAGKPCQDYAAAGDLPNGGAYAIVSDGCSSGDRTDIGARLVTLATEQALRDHADAAEGWMLERAIKEAQRFTFELARRNLGVTSADLLATCGFAFATPGFTFVGLHGDGAIAEIDQDGHLRMTRYEWPNNMPSYPVYMEDDYAAFIREHGGNLDAPTLSVEIIDTRGSTYEGPSQVWPLRSGVNGVYYRPHPGVKRIGVFTDGITQIADRGWVNSVMDLMNFKSRTGEFAKRRLGAQLRSWRKSGTGPMDDLAYAVIDLT